MYHLIELTIGFYKKKRVSNVKLRRYTCDLQLVPIQLLSPTGRSR